MSDDTLSGRVLTDAFRVIPLASGRLMALFRLPDLPQDPTAVGGLMLAKDGREWQLRAATFVPREQLLAGSGGQIYGAAISADEQTAALSVGWLTPRREGRNGIVILRKGADRLFHQASLLPCEVGIGDVAFTSNGDVAAISRFPNRRAFITLFNPSGAVAGALFDDLIAGPRKTSDLQLARIDEHRYALTDLRTATLYQLEIVYPKPHTVSGRVLRTLDLDAGLPARGTLGPIQSVAFLGADEVLAVRQRVAPHGDTIVTIRRAARYAQWQTGHPSRTAFRDGETLSVVTSVANQPYMQQYSLPVIRKGVSHAH